MNTTDTAADDLAEALEAAAPHISIPGVNEDIDVDAYREKLLKVRRVHDVDDAQFVSMVRPVVRDEGTRDRVKQATRAARGPGRERRGAVSADD